MAPQLSARLEALVAAPLIATLATHGKRGVMLSAVWYEWREGGINLSTPPDGVIARNLRRDAHVNLLIASLTPPYCGLEYRGEVSIDDDYLPLITRLAIRYLGEAAGRSYMVGHPPNLRIRLEHGRFRIWDDAEAAASK